MAILSALAVHHPPAPNSLNRDLPAELSSLVTRLLAKDPEGRPESAQSVVESLRAIERRLTTPAAPRQPLHRWALIAAGVVLALGSVGVWLLVRGPARGVAEAVPAATSEPLNLRSTATIAGHTAEIWSVAFSPNGKTLGSCARDKTARLWDLTRENQQSAVLQHDNNNLTSCAFRPDGKMLAVAQGTKVFLWRVEGGAKLAELKGHTGGISGVAFSPNGARLASSGIADQTVRVWNPDAPLEKPLILSPYNGKVPPGPGIKFTSVVCGGDNQTVYAVTDHGKLFFWDIAEPNQATLLEAHPARIETIAVANDGRTIATAGFDHCARLWTKDGKPLGALTLPWGNVLGVAFSPDNRLVATGSSDCLVRLWDRATQKLLATGVGHDKQVFTVAFSPDGCTLASGSFDTTIRLWDTSALVK
jgi:WD40 repeat protein